jgi:iron-sulfur cluster repair protein YtfE (RIC family)
MCQYCGCRAMPLIRDFVAEHDRVMDSLDGALRAIDATDFATASRLVEDATKDLHRHWTGEENGIFTVMAAREDEYSAYIDQLKVEHRELAELLGRVDVSLSADQQELRAAYADLAEHISREEDGLFPASLIALDGTDWNASITAWQEAHPGETMIPD